MENKARGVVLVAPERHVTAAVVQGVVAKATNLAMMVIAAQCQPTRM